MDVSPDAAATAVVMPMQIQARTPRTRASFLEQYVDVSRRQAIATAGVRVYEPGRTSVTQVLLQAEAAVRRFGPAENPALGTAWFDIDWQQIAYDQAVHHLLVAHWFSLVQLVMKQLSVVQLSSQKFDPVVAGLRFVKGVVMPLYNVLSAQGSAMLDSPGSMGVLRRYFQPDAELLISTGLVANAEASGTIAQLRSLYSGQTNAIATLIHDTLQQYAQWHISSAPVYLPLAAGSEPDTVALVRGVLTTSVASLKQIAVLASLTAPPTDEFVAELGPLNAVSESLLHRLNVHAEELRQRVGASDVHMTPVDDAQLVAVRTENERLKEQNRRLQQEQGSSGEAAMQNRIAEVRRECDEKAAKQKEELDARIKALADERSSIATRLGNSAADNEAAMRRLAQEHSREIEALELLYKTKEAEIRAAAAKSDQAERTRRTEAEEALKKATERFKDQIDIFARDKQDAVSAALAELEHKCESKVMKVRQESTAAVERANAELVSARATNSDIDKLLTAERLKVREAGENLYKSAAEIATLKAEIERLLKDDDTRRGEFAQLNGQLRTAQEQVTVANTQKSTINQQLTTKIRESESLQASLNEVIKQKDVLQSKLTAISNSTKAAKDATDSIFEENSKKIQQLESQLSERDATITELKTKLDESKKATASLNEKLAGYQGEVQDLNQQLFTRAEQLAVLQGELDADATKVSTLEKQAAANQTNIKNLQEEKQAIQLQLERTQQDLSADSAEVAELNQQVANLRNDCKKVEETQKSKVAELQQQLATSQKELEETSKKASDAMLKQTELSDLLTEEQAEIAKLKTGITNVSDQLKASRAEVGNLTLKAQESAAHYSKQIEDLLASNAQIEANHSAQLDRRYEEGLRDAGDRITQQIRVLTSQLENAQASARMTEQSLQECTTTVKRLTEQLFDQLLTGMVTSDQILLHLQSRADSTERTGYSLYQGSDIDGH